MKRRLYFLFPDTTQAHIAVDDLVGLGVGPEQMHTVARAGTDLAGLPEATDRQRCDTLAHLEDGLWNGNLVVFGLAAIGLLAAVVAGYWVLALLAILVMVVTVASGAWFAIRAPHVHLGEFRQALHHGEILLMVDVARDRIEDVERLIERRHPEAVTGGSDWAPGLFGT